jgi:hypothetical protein
MSAEQRHEIYDNDGTLIGYESAQADPVTGQFNRYDEANTLCGFAKDSGDVIYHYDKSMRFIGFARLEDGVLREYDRQSNVVGYQARHMTDVEDIAPPVQGYVDFSQAPGTTRPANSAAPSPSIYATPKTYAFSGSSWMGNRFTNDVDDASTIDTEDTDHEGDAPSPSPKFKSAFNEPPNAFRNSPRYEEIVDDDVEAGNPEPNNSGHYAETDPHTMGHYATQPHAEPTESSGYADNNTWQPPPQASTNASNSYAMRGEIVDDVDEYGNEIDPNSAKPFWENMPPGATHLPPLARPSPFASKPSLLQRLLARVMPFFSGKKAAQPTPARSAVAGLPAPERAHQVNTPPIQTPNRPPTPIDNHPPWAHKPTRNRLHLILLILLNTTKPNTTIAMKRWSKTTTNSTLLPSSELHCKRSGFTPTVSCPGASTGRNQAWIRWIHAMRRWAKWIISSAVPGRQIMARQSPPLVIAHLGPATPATVSLSQGQLDSRVPLLRPTQAWGLGYRICWPIWQPYRRIWVDCRA